MRERPAGHEELPSRKEQFQARIREEIRFIRGMQADAISKTDSKSSIYNLNASKRISKQARRLTKEEVEDKRVVGVRKGQSGEKGPAQ